MWSPYDKSCYETNDMLLCYELGMVTPEESISINMYHTISMQNKQIPKICYIGKN